MAQRGRGGQTGTKMKMALGLPTGALINCADNTGEKATDFQGLRTCVSSLSLATMGVSADYLRPLWAT